MSAPAPSIRLAVPLGEEPPSDQRDAVVWRRSHGSVAGLLGLLASVILLAWATRTVDYLQIDPALAPPHYNVAVGLLILGAGHLALARRAFRAARATGGFLVLLGLLGLFVDISAVGLSLDRWAWVPPASAAWYGSGMSGAFSVGMCLTGTALIVAARPRVSEIHALHCVLLGTVILTGAAAGLVASRAQGLSVLLARPSAIGLLGMAVAGLAVLSSVSPTARTLVRGRYALPVVVVVLGVIMTFALWGGLNHEQHNRISRQLQFETAHVRQQIESSLSKHLAQATALAEASNRPGSDSFRQSVGNYMGRERSCLGVARVKADQSLHWVPETRVQAPPLMLEATGAGDPLGRAVRSGRVHLARPPRSAWNGSQSRGGGNWVLLVYAPCRPNAPRCGGVLCVLAIEELFDSIVHINVAPGYAVAVSAGEETIYRRFASQPSYRDKTAPWEETLPIPAPDLHLRVSVRPTREALERESLPLPKLALGIGLLTTSLLALAVHLAQTARRRAFALEAEVREREQTQHALKQSDQKYRTLIENLGQGIFLQDRDLRYVVANAEFCKAVGRAESEVVGRTPDHLFDAPRAARFADQARTVLSEGRSVESEEDRFEGERRVWVRQVLTPVRDPAGQTVGVLGICWDVTEQRRLEAHVHQASKMDAIGQLAGGIAHDFNNLLTAILGNLELILAQTPAGDDCRVFAADARNAALRAASLTQRLLGFARKHHQLNWVPADLTAVVNEVVALLSRTIDPLIRIETRIAPGVWKAQGDPSQLNQVIMNLCLNARDAIRGAGQITLEVDGVRVAAPTDAGAEARGGEFVRLRVSDTGCGMTEDVKSRMFEPFFTTKEVGKGTGLGLPMVFAIVRQHKGWIECQSEVGRGTRFDVYLPRAEADAAASAPSAQGASMRPTAETILVVEDEDMIRRLAGITLRREGYTVLEAADGQQAIDLYARESDRIDLVLLDLTMPVLSGHDAFRHLLAINPQVGVLFASGYAAEQLSDQEKELMVGFINKPYLPRKLVAAVADALQRRKR